MLVWTGRGDRQVEVEELLAGVEDSLEAAGRAWLDDDDCVGGVGRGGDDTVAGATRQFVEDVGNRDQIDPVWRRPAAQIGRGPAVVAVGNEAAAEVNGGRLSVDGFGGDARPYRGRGPGGGSGAAAEVEMGGEGSDVPVRGITQQLTP